MEQLLNEYLGAETAAAVLEFIFGVAGPVLGAIGILLIGWALARVLSWTAYKALTKTTADDWIAENMGLKPWLEQRAKQKGVEEDIVERAAQKFVYWTLMIVVLVAALSVLDLDMISKPLSDMLGTVLKAVPSILKAGAILGVAMVLAFMARFFLKTVLTKLKFDERTSKFAPEETETSMTDTIGNIAFYGILFFALSPILDALHLDALSGPLRNTLDRIVGIIPNLLGAAVILLVGYVISKVVREVVSNLLASVGLDRVTERMGFNKVVKDHKASRIVGIFLQVLIMVQIAISALHNLGIEALAGPLTNMLNTLWNYVPSLLGGFILVVVGVVAGRIAGSMVSEALRSVGLEGFLREIGLGVLEDSLAKREGRISSPSDLVGYFVSYVVILLVVSQILDTLQMTLVAGLIQSFLSVYLLNGLIGVAIICVGFILGGIVQKLIVSNATQENRFYVFLGAVTKYMILIFAFTMAASHIGLGDGLIMLAFGLAFGAFCLALALAFGLGGRTVAESIANEQWSKLKESQGLDALFSDIGASLERSAQEQAADAKASAKADASDADDDADAKSDDA